MRTIQTEFKPTQLPGAVTEGWELSVCAGGSMGGPGAHGRALAYRPGLAAGLKLVFRLAVCLLALLIGGSLHAQNYAIDWFTVDGGGGTSTGGVYSVSGTVGQPDAGKMSGGSYTVDGGFWGIIAAVQTPGAPLLSIALTSTNTAVVSWPSPSTGFQLQQNTNSVSSVNWSNVVTTPTDNGTIKFIVVNPPTGSRFYRLFKP